MSNDLTEPDLFSIVVPLKMEVISEIYKWCNPRGFKVWLAPLNQGRGQYPNIGHDDVWDFYKIWFPTLEDKCEFALVFPYDPSEWNYYEDPTTH